MNCTESVERLIADPLAGRTQHETSGLCEKLGGYIHHKPIPPGSPEQQPLDPAITHEDNDICPTSVRLRTNRDVSGVLCRDGGLGPFGSGWVMLVGLFLLGRTISITARVPRPRVRQLPPGLEVAS